MTEPPARPLATGPLGMELLAFERRPEEDRPGTEPPAYALAALWRRERLLLVRVRSRGCWELPGGGIEPGESPRQAAVREVREETGQIIAAEQLVFAGFPYTRLPDRRVRYGALYHARLTGRLRTFEPNAEIGALHWYDMVTAPPGGELQTVDVHLAGLVRP
ncbi:hypothetical protein GCM10009716_12050 [Streptomyces sodiiphilus]|uniref:Nudix hydrolase domain-containing protein n=1 Tax=Streptomyces sodiiphilus TaxID=226217 RepID=A0ABN2NUR7_9ACTN